LQQHYGISEASALQLSKVMLEPGYGRMSRRAVNKLLPRMREGSSFYEAKEGLYKTMEAKGEKHEILPPVLDAIPELSNPAVTRVLTEMRKVVNALLREMGGSPEWIRIELARDLKNSRDTRQKIQKRNRDNEKIRTAAKEKIKEKFDHESYQTRENIEKVRLADECGWMCPYSGQSISMAALVGDEPQFEIEHIIPFSRSLDNSFLNKTLCSIEFNRNKSNKTPFEAFGGMDDYGQMLSRVRRFKGDGRDAKLRKFMVQSLDEEAFVHRQLNDTRYAARLACRYLGMLYGGINQKDENRTVFPTSGRLTAYLRQRWDLNSILGHADKKDRADHRHHAIDALVTALCDEKAVKALATAAQEAQCTGQKLFAEVNPPFPDMLQQAREAVDAIHVSSRVDRRLAGALHEETILSHPISVGIDKDGDVMHEFHVRKSLASLSSGEVKQIVDDRIRQIVSDALEASGKPPKDTFKDNSTLPALHGKNGRSTTIRRVKIRKSARPIQVSSGPNSRYVAPGANHHMTVIAQLDKDGKEKKWFGEITSRFEANERQRQGLPIVRRDFPEDQRFKFSLCGGDHVLLDRGNGDELCRVVVISGNKLEFVFHSNANPTNVRKKVPGERIYSSVSKLQAIKARKVDVSPLGEIRESGD
ncbi:MAG: type II CRISPR RNA-guided endonuclease Cas9, partial [Planctomycetota bacterium]